MANKIDSTNPPYLPVNGSAGSAKPAATSDGQATRQNDSAHTGADTVQVTESARQMAALEAAVAASNEVDQVRVEAVRAQVQNGNYAVEPQKVADALLRGDQGMPEGR